MSDITLADASAEEICRPLGGCGQGDLIRQLERTPLARAEYAAGVGKGRNRLRIDTSYLCRFDGTDYVQWHGRVASGHFVPFGRIMRIVPAALRPDPKEDEA